MNRLKMKKMNIGTKEFVFLIILLVVIVSIYNFIYNQLYYFNGVLRMEEFKPPEYNLANKRIAICLSGQIRDGYKECLNLIDIFLIKRLNCDVFCCFGDCDNTIKEYVQQKLKPKKIKYVGNFVGDYKKYENNKLTTIRLSMYNKIYVSNELKKQYEKENNFIYDHVIRIRPDLIVKQYLPKEVFEKNNEKIYFPYSYPGHTLLGHPDCMAIGNSKNMDIFSNIFLEYQKKTNVVEICQSSEYFIYDYLNQNRIDAIYIKYMSPIYRHKYINVASFFKHIISLSTHTYDSFSCRAKLFFKK